MPRIGDDKDWIEWRPGSGRSVEITDIAVHSARGEGRGRALVDQMLATLTPGTDRPEGVTLVYAITRMSNAIAHQFYEAVGFRILGRLHYFYRDGSTKKDWEHGLVFGLDL